MKKSRKIFLVVDLILLTATLLFIWINSCIPTKDSASASENALGFLQAIFDFIFGEGVIAHEIFRKIIHGVEFLILGVEICFLFIILNKFNLKNLIAILSIGLFVAVIDEAIQILSNRGPMVKDVLIDFGGFITATAIIYLCFMLIKFIKNKTKKC